MKSDGALYRNGYLFFLGFFCLMLAGFWLTYFTRLADQENYRMHLHGVSLVLWCMMLVFQASLIRLKKYALHRALGRMSYLLVPVLLYTTVDLFQYTMGDAAPLSPRGYVFCASVIFALIIFMLFYGLAIRNRNRPAVHARWMVCTVFPFFTPITDRIIAIHFRGLMPYLPSVDGPVVQSAGLSLAALILAGLSIWDWRKHRRWDIFPVALAVQLFYFFAVLRFHRFEAWQSFCDWFVVL